MITTGHYLAGKLIAGTQDGATEVYNPSTGELIGFASEGSPELVDRAVAAASAASPAWSRTSIAERAAFLDTWREKLLAETDTLIDLTVDELGVIPWFATNIHVARSSKCLVGLDDMAQSIFASRTMNNSLIVREPAGVLGAITAWNFPLHQLVSKIANGLIMGNTVVLKPSEVKPLAAWRATELLAELGLPPGVVNVIGGKGPTVGAALVGQRDIDVISFTGSREVGQAIMVASSATLTRSVLELGGKNPAIVLPDADLDAALASVLGSCFFNNGQVCGAQTRLIVSRDQLPVVEEKVAAIVAATVLGAARAPGATLGPLVTEAQRTRVSNYIDHGVQSGLRVIAGGSGRPDDVPEAGFFVRPTVFSDVPVDHTLAQEEIFGPVLVIQACDDVAEMVSVANSTRYGLTSAVWGADLDEALAIGRQVRSGQVSVNGGMFNLHAPYGGFKESGNGREHGLEGLAEFTEVKSIQLPA